MVVPVRNKHPRKRRPVLYAQKKWKENKKSGFKNELIDWERRPRS